MTKKSKNIKLPNIPQPTGFKEVKIPEGYVEQKWRVLCLLFMATTVGFCFLYMKSEALNNLNYTVTDAYKQNLKRCRQDRLDDINAVTRELRQLYAR